MIFDSPPHSQDQQFDEQCIPLSELTARHVSVEWHEAVACAQAICAAISETAPRMTGGFALFALETDPMSADNAASQLERISLRADGDVLVNSFDLLTEEESVRVVANLLDTLQVRTGCPQAMQTVIDRAMTDPPTFKTVRELSTALSYFERPNGRELMRTLYQRTVDALPSGAALNPEPVIRSTSEEAPPQAPTVAPVTPLPAPVSEVNDTVESLRRKLIGVSMTARSAVDRVASKSGTLSRPLIVTVVVSVVAGLLWYGSSLGAPAETTGSPITLEASAATTANAVEAAPTSAAPTPAAPPPVTPRPPSRSLETPTRPKPSQQTRPSPSQAPLRPVAKPPALVPAVRAVRVEAGPIAPAVAVEVPTAESASPTEPIARPIVNRVAATKADRNFAVPEIVYSANDPDVIPPVRVYPARAEAGDSPKEGAAPIQIVIDKNGRVASAVLTRRPTTMAEAMRATMRLAAAKSWRFQPAVKNGSPVSYRSTLWFADR